MRDFGDLAKELRQDAPEMDDLAKARVEKALLTQPRRAPRPERGHGFRAGVVVGLAAAAAVGIAVWAFPEGADSHVAHVQVFVDGVPERVTEIEEGETVVTAEAQALQVRFGGEGEETCLVDVEPESRVTFDGIDGNDHRVMLDRGSVHVEFHPERRGQEHMFVQTPDARVVVVGTVFEVRVTHDGTVVHVNEGRVRVEVDGREPAFVGAGEVLHVAKDQLAVADPEPAVSGPVAEEELAAESEVEVAAAEVSETAEVARPRERTSENVQPTTPDEPEAESVTEAVVVAPERAREPVAPPIPLSDDARFDLARQLFDTGELAGARHELYAIARTTPSVRARARAWTLVAETYERESDVGRAIEAYRRAAQSGRTHAASDALFALARLRIASGEVAAGKAAYREYLQVAPDGALAATVRRALCRLGESEYCAE